MMNWKQKRVLVTGATGLVGSWLVKELLNREAFVAALIRDHDPQSELIRSGDYLRLSLVQGELEDYLSVERAINEHEIDTVFHLGAQTIVGTAFRSPLSTFESNIRGTYHLLEACRRHAGLIQSVVIASSDKAYGTSKVLPYAEEMPLNGKNPYDVSKSCTDLLASSYYHTYQLPITIIRCGNIYGGGDLNWSRIIPGTIRSYLFSQAPVIRSDGTFTRDYVFVEDIVNAYLLIPENMYRNDILGQSFNFGPNRPFSVLEVVSMLQSLMGKKNLHPKILNNTNGEIKNQSLSSAKIYSVLGWKPKFSLREGLEKTIQWYENYLNLSSHAYSAGGV